MLVKLLKYQYFKLLKYIKVSNKPKLYNDLIVILNKKNIFHEIKYFNILFYKNIKSIKNIKIFNIFKLKYSQLFINGYRSLLRYKIKSRIKRRRKKKKKFLIIINLKNL